MSEEQNVKGSAPPSPPPEGGNKSLLEEIVELTAKPTDRDYVQKQKGVKEILKYLVAKKDVKQVNRAVLDAFISELDKQIGEQVDEVLHNDEFQKLESAWRSLKFLVDRTDFRENIKIEILNAPKDELIKDFDFSPDILKSGLYKKVYTENLGQFGGIPFSNIIGNYEFGPDPEDVELLENIASISAMSHAPFISAISPQMLKIKDFTEMPYIKSIKDIFEDPEYADWRAFRDSEDARYVGLTLPRFLLRLPYGPKTKKIDMFNYEEKATDDHNKYLWGNAAFALASRMVDSFAKYRWYSNIIGPQSGGTVDKLPVHNYIEDGINQTKIPTEVLIPDRQELTLSEEGFIGLSMRKGSNNAAFFSANSTQKPQFFGDTEEGKKAETNFKLGTQLPYMAIINRLAHYIKVIQRENIGSWKDKLQLETQLKKWISQYVVDMVDIKPATRCRKPLRKAEIIVNDVDGDPGWYEVGIDVQPHYKYMGAYFTLSLVGKLDQE